MKDPEYIRNLTVTLESLDEACAQLIAEALEFFNIEEVTSNQREEQNLRVAKIKELQKRILETIESF